MHLMNRTDLELTENPEQVRPATPTPSIESEVPDSGWRAWLVVFGAFCANAITVGFMNSTGTIQDYLLRHTLAHESESNVGWIFSIYLFLMLLGGIQSGPLVDAFGIKPVVIPGCLLWCASLMILSVCREYYQFILGFSVLGGLSSSLIYNPSYTVLGQWFTTKKPVAIGLAAVGSSAVGSFLPIALTKMFSRFGYAWSIRILGFAAIGLSVITCVTMRSRIVQPTKPAQWRDATIDLACLKSPDFSWSAMAISLEEWAYFLPALYIVGYARSTLEFTTQDSNLLLVYMNVSSTAGRFGGGVVARYFGSFNTIIASTFLSGLTSFCLWLPLGTSSVGIKTFVVFFGIFSGVGMSLGMACVASISSPTNFGRRYGTSFAIVSLAVLTSFPIGGLLTARSYIGMKIITGAAFLASSLSFLIARKFTPRATSYI